MIKFADNTDTIINLSTSKVLNKFWAQNAFSGEFRTFIFKLHNNRLGFNYIISKFIRGVSENCTFCRIARLPENSRETPLHLFYDCDITSNIYSEFFTWLLLGTGENLPSRQEFFPIFKRINNYTNQTLTIIIKLGIFLSGNVD